MNDQTFNGLGNLKHLKLNNNNLTGEMPNKTFEYMTCLADLDLSFNKLERINLQTFVGLQNLQNLQLNDNKLNYYIINFPKGSFKPLESLTRLSIHKNNFLSWEYSTVFPDRTISDLTMLEILELDVSSGLDHKPILGKGFSSLKNLHLLNVSSCTVFTLENDTFMYTPNLTDVYINYCSLRVYSKGHEVFSKLMNLKVLQLNASNQPHPWIEENILFALISGLSETPIEILKMSYLLNLINSPSLSIIINKISILLNKAPIKELDFTKNENVHVSQMDIPVQVPSSIRILDLSANSLKVIKLNVKQVIFLNLEDNSLGNYLANNSLMMEESSLEYISLSNNSIYKLHTTIFIGQKFLRVIDLRLNFLKDINFDMNSLVDLENLNLKNNKIKYLSDQSIKKLDKVFKNNGNAKIDLSNNPLRCNCFTLPFLNWMRNEHKHFNNFMNYRCEYENGSFSLPNSFEDVILHLQRDCTNHSYLIISVSFVVLAFIAVLSAAIIYRHRWKLRYLFYTAKLKYTSHRNMEEKFE
ncbi:unnamed protein product [Mytilus coruscus]|uniref:LRRCT domain-containing protein n=1 Tax=Mytilus coruscus TaxID=42192 RepID=A0A6J8CH75_MYTCO|nr:unnamed protein product [Mytilus coruscus]